MRNICNAMCRSSCILGFYKQLCLSFSAMGSPGLASQAEGEGKQLDMKGERTIRFPMLFALKPIAHRLYGTKKVELA